MNVMVKRRVHVAAAAIISADGREVLLARPEGERTPPDTWRLPLTVPALPNTL